MWETERERFTNSEALEKVTFLQCLVSPTGVCLTEGGAQAEKRWNKLRMVTTTGLVKGIGTHEEGTPLVS